MTDKLQEAAENLIFEAAIGKAIQDKREILKPSIEHFVNGGNVNGEFDIAIKKLMRWAEKKAIDAAKEYWQGWTAVEYGLPPFNTKVWFRAEISWKKANDVIHFEDELTMETETLEYGQFGYLLKNRSDFIVTQSNMPKNELCSEFITHWMPLPSPPTK